MVRLNDRLDMTIAVYRGRKATTTITPTPPMVSKSLRMLVLMKVKQSICEDAKTIRNSLSLRMSSVGPGRIAQSVGHLTRKSGVLGSIPGLATYFRFSFLLFQERQLSVTGESMCTKYWLTA